MLGVRDGAVVIAAPAGGGFSFGVEQLAEAQAFRRDVNVVVDLLERQQQLSKGSKRSKRSRKQQRGPRS